MKKTTLRKLVLPVLIASLLLVLSSCTASVPSDGKSFAEKDIEGKRLEFLEEKGLIITEMQSKGEYTCCLEQPCTYCIEKTPKHGEGAACNCAQDVLSGVHPCGECIGEIMEGHGDPNLAKYFARSIAEEVGEEHLPTLKKIMTDKYDISIEEQVE